MLDAILNKIKVTKSMGYKTDYAGKKWKYHTIRIPGDMMGDDSLTYPLFMDQLREFSNSWEEFERILFLMRATHLPVNRLTVLSWENISKPSIDKVDDIFDSNGNYFPDLTMEEIHTFLNDLSDKEYYLKEYLEKNKPNIRYDANIIKLYYEGVININNNTIAWPEIREETYHRFNKKTHEFVLTDKQLIVETEQETKEKLINLILGPQR